MKRVLCCVIGLLTWTAVATAQDVCAPAKVTNLAVGTGKTTAVLTWTSTGDDCSTGSATSYEIYQSGSTITDTNWQSASLVATGSAAFGCRAVGDLVCNATYYWAIFMIDDAGNRSPISNVAQGTTQSCVSNLEVECD
jgi:hypothetical protein